MREIDLWLDRQNNQFVQSLASSSPLPNPGLQIAKNNGITWRIHNAVLNPSVPAVTPYIEAPLSYTALRASLTLGADQPPTQGSFCFQVATALGAVIGTSTAITWNPSSGTWKATCLAALNAIAGLGDTAAIADLPNTPANFFYYTWANPANTNVITIVNNELQPLCEAIQEGSFTEFGYTQLVKAILYPIAMTPATPDPNAFQSPATPAITTENTQPGGGGKNQNWTILVPDAAAGSVAFSWSGSQTNPIAISALTASSIASALNAIVANGASNPSFSVAAADVLTGTAWSVTYIGPLANAAQASIGVVMLNQQPAMYSQGVMDLTVEGTALSVEQALNGQPQIDAVLEVVIDNNGEETILLPILLLNDMTTPATEVSAENAGAITTVTNTVVVDNSTLEPFASTAPGFSYVPAVAVAAGATQAIDHDLDTLTPFVWGVYQDPALGAGQWRALQSNGEFSWVSTDLNHINITCPFAITTGPTDAYYFGRLKFFISAPDAIIQIFGTLFTSWAQCTSDGTSAGTTVAAQFAAIESALGIIDGNIQIDASNIDGTLEPSQLDMSALATALQTTGTFLTTLQNLISDPTTIQNIATALATSTNFLSTLTNLFTTNTTLLNSLATALTTNNAFITSIRQIITAALTGQAGALSTTVLFQLPDLTAPAYPPLPVTPAGQTPLSPLPWSPVPAAIFSPGNGGAAPKYLPRPTSANLGYYYTVGSGGAQTALRKKVFYDGDVIYTDGNDWYKAGIDGTKYYALEYNRDLGTYEITEDEFSPGSSFVFQHTFTLGFTGNCRAFYRYRLLLGHERDEANDALPTDPKDADTFVTDTTLITSYLTLGNAPVTQTFGYTVVQASGGALTATKQINLKTNVATTAPGHARFMLREILDEFDVDDIPNPAGQVTLTGPKSQVATISSTT